MKEPREKGLGKVEQNNKMKEPREKRLGRVKRNNKMKEPREKGMGRVKLNNKMEEQRERKYWAESNRKQNEIRLVSRSLLRCFRFIFEISFSILWIENRQPPMQPPTHAHEEGVEGLRGFSEGWATRQLTWGKTHVGSARAHTW